MERPPRPDLPEQLDRPYGDQDEEYLVIEPEGPPPEPHAQMDDIVAEQEAEAAAEARAIGGRPSEDTAYTPDDEHHGSDPAFLPVQQAGGGQAEGFEEAEGLLIDHATVPPDADRAADAFDPDDPGTDVDPDWQDDVEKQLTDVTRLDTTAGEQVDPEALRATGVAGEPDEIRSTEVTFDPDEPPDDPGRGPGLAFER